MVKDTALIKQIGRGLLGGIVYKAYEYKNPIPVAVKVMDISNGRGKIFTSDEGWISYELEHENIVRTHRYYTCDKYLILHMELLEGDTLMDLRFKNRKIDVFRMRNILKGVRAAVDYLHSKNITHGDIHQNNVMLEENGRVKLIDFGCPRKHECCSESLEHRKMKDINEIANLQNHFQLT